MIAFSKRWRLDRSIFQAARLIPLSPRGELELPAAVEYSMSELGTRYRVLPFAEPVLERWVDFLGAADAVPLVVPAVEHAADVMRQLDRVDAFLLHDPPLEVIRSEAVIDSLRSVKDRGLTSRTGISSPDPVVVAAALASGVADVIQSPASLRVVGEILPIQITGALVHDLMGRLK